MIDFEQFRYDLKGSPGNFEDWLESIFQAIFSVDGYRKFELDFNLETRVYILELLLGLYSFYDNSEKHNYCETLYDQLHYQLTLENEQSQQPHSTEGVEE